MKQNKWLKLIPLGAIGLASFAMLKGRFFFGIVLAIVGIIIQKWLDKNQARPSSENFQLTDDMIVRFANLRGGIISANELASQTSLSVEQAKMRLEKLVKEDIATLSVSNNGNILYDFKKNILDWEEKNSAERL